MGPHFGFATLPTGKRLKYALAPHNPLGMLLVFNAFWEPDIAGFVRDAQTLKPDVLRYMLKTFSSLYCLICKLRYVIIVQIQMLISMFIKI